MLPQMLILAMAGLGSSCAARLGAASREPSGGPSWSCSSPAPVLALALSASASAAPQSAGRLAGKTYVITGASSGFGCGVALKLGAQAANVVLAARRTGVLNQVAAQVRAAGGTPLVMTTDVAKPGDIARLAHAAVARFGRIDCWINDAGVAVFTRFWDAPVQDYSRLIDVNLKGVVYGSQAAIRQFRAQGYGTLVNIGSIEGEVPMAYQAAYSATKAAVFALDRALNEELRLDGLDRSIKVSTIMPWAADTPLWQHAANYTGRTPRMAATDDPNKVVDAIIWASLHPKEAIPVGWKAQASYVSHRILPSPTERFSADLAHREQMQKGAPAPPTSGTLYRPMQAGQGVEGGARARMKQEDEQRRAAGSR